MESRTHGEADVRRTFLKTSAAALGAADVSNLDGPAAAGAAAKARVYFTRAITVEGLLKIYARINQGMTGRVGIKLHSGEPHGPNLLPVELIRGLQAQRHDLVERIESRGGRRQLEYMKTLKMGNDRYELIHL